MPVPEAENLRKRPLLRWFVGFGVVGFIVAFFLLYALSHGLVIADYAIFFWPTSMILLSPNEGFWTKTLTIGFAFGGNFLLYGLGGLILGYFVDRIRSKAPRS